MSPDVRLVEVGPRDGLQNEPQIVATAVKLELIHRLARSGLRHIEVTSFVSPKWVPQMADHAEILRGLDWGSGVSYPVLTPNLQGFEAAVACGAREVAVFASASEAFSRKNINCSVDESLARFEPVVAAAARCGVKVRAYVSCIGGCPYEGHIPAQKVAVVASALHHMGCYEISLGDTIGSALPEDVAAVLEAVTQCVPIETLAGHFHDTRGMALDNILASYEYGVRTFDASVSGLGGCPYATGASGNVATEDVVLMFDAMGVATGVDAAQLIDCSLWISAALQRMPSSRAARLQRETAR